MKPKIGIQLYSVRNETEKDFKGTLKKLKDMGYDGVEFAGMCGLDASSIVKALKETDMIPVSAHVPLNDLRKDMEKVIADYREIGVTNIAVPFLLPPDRPESGNFDKTVADIKKIADVAMANGIKLHYHNHDFEFAVIDGKYALYIIYESIPKTLLSAEFDSCWIHVAGEDPAEYIKRYADRITLVHLKDYFGKKSGKMYGLIGVEDNRESSKAFEFRPVGHGAVNM